MSTRKTTLFYAVLIAIASLAVGMVIASQWGLPPSSSAQTVNIPAANSAPLSGPIDAQTFRNIAKSQSPTVVNIQTTSKIRGSREMTEFFGGGDDLLRRFFGGQVPPQQRNTPRGRPAPRGDDEGKHAAPAPASSSTRAASSSRTITSSKAPRTSGSASTAGAGPRATRPR